MIKELLTSKRLWVAFVAGGTFVAAKFGYIIPDQPGTAEALATAALAIGTVVTKVIDVLKSQK